MEDKLKHWIETQRDDFDLYEADFEASWKNIADRVSEPKVEAPKPKRALWISIAASVSVILLTCSVFLYSQYKSSDSLDVIFSGNEELAEARDYYTSEINYKLTAAKELVKDQQVFKDIDDLDVAFDDLKKDLKDDVHNEEVIIAMVENYQLKLKILNKILSEFEKERNRKQKGGKNENI